MLTLNFKCWEISVCYLFIVIPGNLFFVIFVVIIDFDAVGNGNIIIIIPSIYLLLLETPQFCALWLLLLLMPCPWRQEYFYLEEYHWNENMFVMLIFLFSSGSWPEHLSFNGVLPDPWGSNLLFTAVLAVSDEWLTVQAALCRIMSNQYSYFFRSWIILHRTRKT